MAAAVALVEFPGLQGAVAVVTAMGAAEAARPPPFEQRLGTLLFSAVVPEEFSQAVTGLELHFVFAQFTPPLISKTCILIFDFKIGCGFYVIK